MTFICPIAAGSAGLGWQGAVHLGLLAGLVVAGLVFLAFAFVAYRRDVRAGSQDPRLPGAP